MIALVVRSALGLFACAVLAACANGPKPVENPNGPALVAAAHPLAVKAGADILAQGGSAVDAAVAVQAVLTLVEPQSSGFGGGAFLVHFDASTGDVTAYDGREEAPAGATPDMFLDADGAPLGYLAAKHSGLAIGAPGAADMLHLAHADHGRLAWAALFDDAITLADTGFAVTPRLHGWIARASRFGLKDAPDTAAYFFTDDGAPLPVGHRLVNTEYAASLRALAEDPRALNEGPIAAEIAAAAQVQPKAGTLTIEDLAAYQARKRDPICRPYREMTVCSAPPPSSGGVAVNAALGILETVAFAPGGAQTPVNWLRLVEAMRLSYADRDRYVADDRFVDVPVAGLLSPDYLATRAALIAEDAAMASVAPGDPWAHHGQPGAEPLGADAPEDTPGTSHFVIVDAYGDVVSMTTTIEGPFGSLRMAGGMLLNNQLTDFARDPVDADGAPRANRPEPGKRPRSSMSPTIALDADGEFLFATGSPGGNSIIAYTLKSLVGVLDWGLTPQEAADLPNVVARGDVIRVEPVGQGEDIRADLATLGFTLADPRGENSGIHSVLRKPDGSLAGAADNRREGVIATIPPQP